MPWVGRTMDRKATLRQMAEEERKAAEVWRVLRHSGRGGGPEVASLWREVFAGPEVEARQRYSTIRLGVRQGGVRLVTPKGEIDSEHGAPRLRTRW